MSALIDGRQPIIFCDYDGTITEEDVIQMVMRTFAPPEWKTIVADILDHRTLSIKEGLNQLFALLPSSQRDDIIKYVRSHVRFREGFESLLSFCSVQGIPFLVVSGGVDFLITPMLERLSAPLELYCNLAQFEGDRIRIETPWAPETCEPCQQCACCKIRILDNYNSGRYYRITIGDSLTDLGMTERADLAFARARLLDYVKDKQLPVTPFETFSDIQAVLATRLESVLGGVL